MTAQLAPTPIFKAWDNNGLPLFLGQLFTYAAGTTTPQATYTDSTQTTQNTNPVILNARGEANVWFDPTLSYKFVLQDSLGNQIWSVDNIPGALRASGNIVPTADNVFSLGNASFRFANGYFGTQLYVGSSNTPILNGGIVGYWPRTAAEIAAGVTPTNYAYAPGVVDRYGTNTTPGTTDMTAALQAAVAQMNSGGDPVQLLGAIYACTATLTFSATSWAILGKGRNSSQIKWTAAVPGITVSGQFGLAQGVYFNGNSIGTTGITCTNSSESIFENCQSEKWTVDGATFNTAVGKVSDFTEFRGGGYTNNGRYGISVPVHQGDNNSLMFLNVECNSNNSGGILYAGTGAQFINCNVENNGGYGIQLSNAGDSQKTTGCQIFGGWLESNTSGGIYGAGQSQGNIIINTNGPQSYTAAAGSHDSVLGAGIGPNGYESFQMGDGTNSIAIEMTATAVSIKPIGTATNIPLWLAGKGTGGIQLAAFGATDYLSFFGVPVVQQPTTAVASSNFTANSGTAINASSTFDGYTLAQVVKALRNLGVLQ